MLILWRVFVLSKRGNAWTSVCDPKLLSFLLVGQNTKLGLLPFFLTAIVGSLIIFSAAGPAWEKLPQIVMKSDASRVFVLDLSRSMDSTDLLPSRANRAKLKLIDLLNSDDEGQVALIVYAAQAHIVSPLTDDSNTVINMVSSLSTGIMPEQGSRADLALIKAMGLLRQAGSHRGEVVLLTDGVNQLETFEAIKKLTSAGYQLNVLGIGTLEGSPIPIQSGGFLKDNSGAIVIPKLDQALLKEVALAGQGLYQQISSDDSDVKALIKPQLIDGQNTTDENPMFREADLWDDQGHTLLLFALLLSAFGFRKGWLSGILVSILIFPPNEALAFEWTDLWQTKDQQAKSKMENAQFEEAANLFENKDWKGAAYYKSGKFEQAAESFATNDSAMGKYNYANALAKQGKLQEAIDVYDLLLKDNPNHEDARFNRELVKKLLDDQQSNQENSQDSENNEDKDSEQDQQDSNQDSSSEQQNDEQSESEQQQESNQNDQSKDDQDEQKQQQEGEQQDNEEQKSDEKQSQDSQDETQQQEGEMKKPESEMTTEEKELKQATEQWLRRIPDDPGGLLREKFRRENLRRRNRSTGENPW